MTLSSPLQLQVIAVLVLHILANPQHDTAQADQRIADQIRHAHPQGGPLRPAAQVLEHKHRDAAGQPAGQRREAHEEHDAGLPRRAVARGVAVVARQPRLVDAVDDQHAQRREDGRHPVDESDVEVGGVALGGPGCGVNEDEEGD